MIGAAADELHGAAGENAGAAGAAGDRDLKAAIADGCRRPLPPESTISVPPLFTVVLLTTVPLVTSNVPLLMTQPPPLPLTFQCPPTTLKLVKPLYCVPIESRSNVSEPLPPSWKASLPEASTSPLMT
jgi:hypothetical protein